MAIPADAVSAVAREVLVALERLLTQAAIGAALVGWSEDA